MNRTPSNKWYPLLAACLGTLMLLIDVTIVNVALPQIEKSLHANLTALQWVMDAYALVLAALLLTMGAIADGIGHRRVFLTGTALFALASLACGFANNPAFLITARAVQGIGGAAMFATTVALLHATYSGKDRGIAFSVWGATSGAAAGVGVVLGGVITDALSWRWIFFVNIPISVVTLAVAWINFKETPRRSTRFDILGMVTFTVLAAALTYGVIHGGETSWTSIPTVAGFILAVIGLLAFVAVERTVSNPMLPLGLLTSPRFTGSLVGALGQSFAAFATLPLLAIWMESVLNLSPTATGLAMLPLAGVAFLTAGILGRVMAEFAPQWTVGFGLVVIGIGSGLLTMIGSASHWYVSTPGFVVIGIGVGIAAPALAATAMSAVPARYSGVASGAVNTARQLGLALGIAIVFSVFTAYTSGTQSRKVGAFTDGLDAAFTVAACVGVVTGLIAMVLLSRKAEVHDGASAQPPLAEVS